MKRILFQAFLLVFSLSAFGSKWSSPLDLNPVYQWTEYSTIDGVRIEYKFAECHNASVTNQVLVLFRYTNTTGEDLKVTWKRKVFRNGTCVNCQRLQNAEYGFELMLSPNQVIQGKEDDKSDERLYLFSNFIELSPGMSNQRLTDFEMVNVEVEIR